jgi:hypothetical protein
MSQKNYFVRENRTEQQYFCQLQVSNKFRKDMSADELELCTWMVQTLVHHSITEVEFREVLHIVQARVDAINLAWDGTRPFLVMTYVPLLKTESGYIRIERANRKHQSLLLPVIDFRGEVKL